jgi:hypothetical protein
VYDVDTQCYRGEIKMLRTTVQLEEEQVEWLRSNASARGVSVSQLIREMVNLYRFHIKMTSENQKSKALEAVERFSSEAPDVAEQHDNYLAEAYRKRDC